MAWQCTNPVCGILYNADPAGCTLCASPYRTWPCVEIEAADAPAAPDGGETSSLDKRLIMDHDARMEAMAKAVVAALLGPLAWPALDPVVQAVFVQVAEAAEGARYESSGVLPA